MKGIGKGAQEWKRDTEGPWNQLEDDEQKMDVSQDQASSSTSMTKDPPGPSTTNIVTPGRIGRQRSFLKKSLLEETQSENKSPRGEHGNLLKGISTPKFVLEIQEEGLGETFEQSMHVQTLVRPHLKKSLLDHEETHGNSKSPSRSPPRSPPEHRSLLKVVSFPKSMLESHRETPEQSIVRRLSGWPYNRRVDWKENLTLDTKVDEDEKEPMTYDSTSSSTSSSPSPPSSPLQRVAIDKVDHEFHERNPSEKSLSPLFSTPRQTFDNFPPTFDHCPHTHDSIDNCPPSNDSSDHFLQINEPCPHSNDSSDCFLQINESCPPTNDSSDRFLQINESCPPRNDSSDCFLQINEPCPPSNDSSDHFPHISKSCPLSSNNSSDHFLHSNQSCPPSPPLSLPPSNESSNHCPHSNEALLHKEDENEDLVKPNIAREGSEGLLAQSTSPTTSTSSILSTRSTTLSLKSLDLNEALNTTMKLDVNQALSMNGDRLKAQPGEAEPGSVKSAGSSYKIMPPKCLMRSQAVPYCRRRSSSCIPSQESDLLKEWTQKCLEDMEERRIKSKEGQKKGLEEAQSSRDAFYEERRAEIEERRAKNRQQEQQQMEESPNPMLSTNMNQWELVVSLINLERPTGPPAEKDDKKRLLVGTPSQLQPGPPKVLSKVLTKALSRKSYMKQEKNQVINSHTSEETLEEQNKPVLKNTDLSRMKEILLKLKQNPNAGGK